MKDTPSKEQFTKALGGGEFGTEAINTMIHHVLNLHPDNFSNGRFMRNAFQTATMNLAHRVATMQQPTDVDFI